jgi:SAM-dependent methyltransferase
MTQAYGEAFARVYARRWGGFAREVAPRVLDLYAAWLAGRDPLPVLDLCCGTGDLAAVALERGHRVIGVDLSPAMLREASARNRAAVHAGRARFVEGDARDFRLDEPVGLVVSTYDALNHLPDLEALAACFRAVARALVPGGLLVFDLNTRRGLLERWNGTSATEDDDALVLMRARYDGGPRATAWITGFVRRPDGAYDRFDEQVSNTLFPTREVADLLRAAGFGDVRFTDGRDLAAPARDPEAEGRVFVVATRQA